MNRHPFGDTGLEVSPLGFGAGSIDGLGDHDAEALLNGVLDLGVNVIDTARGYGRSEEMIGRFLSHRRDEFVLVSKCGYGIAGVPDWTPECIVAGIDEALKRLRTDRLDAMLFHSCPKETLLRPGLIEAMETAVQTGKVRFAGYSGENEDLAAALQSGRFRVLETSVNLFDQRSRGWALPKAAGRGIAVVGKRPFGNFAWRYRERPAGQYAEEYWTRLQAMNLTPPEGMGWGEYAIRFAAHSPGVGTAVAGTSKLAHFREAAEWVEKGPLPEDAIRAAETLFQQNDRDWVGQV